MAANLREIGALNNLAVNWLMRGGIRKAHTMLERALSNFHHKIIQDRDSVTQDANQATTVSTTQGFAFQGVRAIPVHPEFSKGDATFSPENVFQVFDLAFLLPTQHQDRDDTAVVILYNLGLVLHRIAILEGRQSILEKSLKIYSMAAALLLDEGLWNHRSSGLTLLHLATWNNQGFIYYYVLEHETAMLCAEQVRDILQVSRDLSPVDAMFFRRSLFYIDVFPLPKYLSPAA